MLKFYPGTLGMAPVPDDVAIDAPARRAILRRSRGCITPWAPLDGVVGAGYVPGSFLICFPLENMLQ
jgi:hypothetical protein